MKKFKSEDLLNSLQDDVRKLIAAADTMKSTVNKYADKANGYVDKAENKIKNAQV